MRRVPARHRVLVAACALLVTAACGAAGAVGEAGHEPGEDRAAARAAPASEAPLALPAIVTNADGSRTTITDASRVIPLNGDIAEIVFALGLGTRVVATDLSATFPPEATRVPRIGYQRRLSAEGILGLGPTVVIGDTQAGPPQVIEQIRGAGVTTVILPDLRGVDAPPRKIRAVAQALGVPATGEELARRVEAEIGEARARAARSATRPRALLLYLRGAGTQLVAGEGSGFDSFLEAAGALDAARQVGLRGMVPITPEALVAAAPDVLLVTTGGLASVGGVEGLLTIPGIAQTPAGRDRRVLAYEDGYLLAGGPRTGRALAQVAADLHAASAVSTPTVAGPAGG